MGVSMVVPMTAWMRIRGRSWRDGAEMAVAMLGPVAVILALSRVGLSDTLPWHSNSEHTAMLLGMLAIMLYRRGHYTGSTPSFIGWPGCAGRQTSGVRPAEEGQPSAPAARG